MKLTTNTRVKKVFEAYPDKARGKMIKLRALLLQAAEEMDGLLELEETLKWGEPSYIAQHGSTIRMDWKEKTSDCVAVYFKCTSQLVRTFKTIYKDVFRYEGTRAIVFMLDEAIPEKELKHCIKLALNYHKLKKLPLLGA
jgi:hypothetical protein